MTDLAKVNPAVTANRGSETTVVGLSCADPQNKTDEAERKYKKGLLAGLNPSRSSVSVRLEAGGTESGPVKAEAAHITAPALWFCREMTPLRGCRAAGNDNR